MKRRALLAAMAALAGCAKYGDEGAAPAPSSSSGAAPLAKTADVPVGGGTVLTDRKLVVTQPTKGEFKAFSAICTHQGCTVKDVTAGTINCPCHGSKFRVTDASVAAGPAPRPLAEQPITVRGGEIRLA
jgi:Rieske Fe-S protein